MRWKISTKGSDEITRGHQFEFEIEKSLDDLIAGDVGQSIDHGIASAAHRRAAVRPLCSVPTFCSDVIVRGVAERGRSRTIRPERSGQFMVLSPWRARGCTLAADACPVLISQSPRSPISALTVRRQN